MDGKRGETRTCIISKVVKQINAVILYFTIDRKENKRLKILQT